MRPRALRALACLGLTTLLTGCFGAAGQKAQALLQRAAVAHAAVSSETVVIKVNVEVDGRTMGVVMQGGAYLKGPHAGDVYLSADGTGEAAGGTAKFDIVKRGDVVTFRSAQGTQRLSLSQAATQLGSSPADMMKFLDLAKYVKSVSVDETNLGDRPADRITGTLDTNALIGGLGGLGISKLLGQAGVHFGNVRAVIFIPRDTHLVEVLFADLDIEAQGKTAHMHESVSIGGIDQPISFPLL